MKERIRRAGIWVTDALVVRRWQAVLIAGSLGLIIASGIYYYKVDRGEAADQRAELRATDNKLKATDQKLADAIKRLAALEKPTRQETRKQLKRLLDVVTPSQARRVADIIENGVPPAAPFSPRGNRPGAPRGNNPSPPGFNPPGSVNPPNVDPPGGGGHVPDPPNDPSLLDVPPLDLDGPGPLPPIDLPPIPMIMPPFVR